ncbi:Ferric reduction oxidase 8 [Diplonema papillatum]|nr:Ferric reduction oxidase 8 [Diplonema papillatum]
MLRGEDVRRDHQTSVILLITSLMALPQGLETLQVRNGGATPAATASTFAPAAAASATAAPAAPFPATLAPPETVAPAAASATAAPATLAAPTASPGTAAPATSAAADASKAPDTAPPRASDSGAKVTWNSDFLMEWNMDLLDANASMTVTYRCRDGQYCAIGIGSTMANADTILCTESGCQSGHTTSYTAPRPDSPDKLESVRIVDDGDFYLATWRRAVVVPGGKAFNSAGQTSVIWASGNAKGNEPEQHGPYGSYAGAASIDFAKGSVEKMEEQDADPLLYALSMTCLFLILAGGFAANRMLSRVRGLGYWIFVKNAGSVLCLFMFALACGLFLWAFWDKDAWYHAFGPLAELLFCVVFTLPSGKGSIVWHTLRIPHERVIFFHRVLGSMIPVVITIHGIGHYIDNEWTSLMFSFAKFGAVSPLPGLFVLIASILIIVPAIPALKAKSFEFFLFSHWLLVPTIIIFSVLHTKNSIRYFVPGLFMHTVNGLLSKRKPFGIVVSEDITAGRTYAKLKIRVEDFGEVGPGAYVYLRLPGDMFQSHPFSVVEYKGNCVTLGIKSMGSGTSTEMIVNRVSPGDSVTINGPFGKPAVAVDEYANVLMMGGGIGVTPLLGTAAWLARKGVGNVDVHLHWAVREAALPKLFLSELIELSATIGMRITLYYTGKEAHAAEHLGMLPSFIDVVRSRPDYGFILSQYTSTSKGAMNEALLASNGAAQVAVLLCGPAPMTDSIRDTITSKTWGNTRFDVHTEVFAL